MIDRLDRRQVGLVAAAVTALGAAIASVVVALSAFGTDGLDAVFGPVLGGYGAILYVFVGVVVLWRRPGHGIGRLALTIGLAFTVSLLVQLVPWPSPVDEVSRFLSSGLLLAGWVVGGSLLVVRFPSGHRTSRLGIVVEVALAAAVVAMVIESFGQDLRDVIGPSLDLEPMLGVVTIVAFGGILITYLGALLDLGLRYRPADTIGRVQMRWVLAAEAISVGLVILLALFGDTYDDLFILWLCSMGLPVLAIAIALTRYHLYDIDRIISRSISYATVTAVLFAAFAATTLLLQRVVTGAFTSGGELEPWVVAASTLLVAAMFNPVRSRVQSAVDRRFHRARYDTARIVAGFSGRLRDQLDLPTVTDELRMTTGLALEPATTGVWLRARSSRQ